MASTRHDGDYWDLTSSVGATATASAAARAIATRSDPALINDPFAEPLVRAVGIDLLTRLASGETAPGELVEQVWIDIAKIRTKFYDEYFLQATGAGIRQVVILAAGLDSRAYRLPWPTGTVVYELDQPDVVNFKTRTLSALGATPTADRRVTAADLRDDWPTALRSAGFDPTQPTAWSAEGLLSYLPSAAQDHLLDTITTLSAPTSHLATESKPNSQPGEDAKTKARLTDLSTRWQSQNYNPQMTTLRYYGPRNEAAPYLSTKGWTVTTTPIHTLLSTNNLEPLPEDDTHLGDTSYVSATLAG